MSEVRVIKFNEDLFKIPSGTQRKKPDKPIKVKQPRKVSDKTLRNRVLNEIRKNQEQQYRSLIGASGRSGTTSGASEEFNKDFDQSLEYMNQLAGKVKEEQKEKERNATLRVRSSDFFSQSGIEDSLREPGPSVLATAEPSALATAGPSVLVTDNLIPVQLSDEPFVLKPAPALPYGCMRVGGTLPTYRAYHNTLKVQPQSIQPSVAQPIKQPFMKPISTEQDFQAVFPKPEPAIITERILSPTEVAQEMKSKQQLVQKPKFKRVKKLLRRTYRAGKDKFKPRVGVLLPNKTIRSNITTKAYMLKQTPIEEIRKTLVKKGFIKHGSSAPNDVLRKIFESIQMIGGEVSNYNSDNLLYNFFETKE